MRILRAPLQAVCHPVCVIAMMKEIIQVITDAFPNTQAILSVRQKHVPEMNFRAIMSRLYGTLICPVGTARNSAAIYCRLMIQV